MPPSSVLAVDLIPVVGVAVPAALGLAAVYLLLPQPGRRPVLVGALLGVLGLLILGFLVSAAGPSVEAVLFYVFSAIAIIAGVLLITQQFPEQQPKLPPNYRGVHRLNRDEQGRVKCVACYMCSTACPARCIDIVAAPAPPEWKDREKYPETFVIDELRCIYCGMCEQACPCDAIELTSLYDLTGMSREEMMFDKEKLLSVFDQTIAAGTDPIRTHSGKLGVASEPKL